MNDLKMFCTHDNNPITLAVDTTFNLCDLWITDTSYRNQRLINRESQKHPVFLGPMMLHFTKNVETFQRFAMEIVNYNHKLYDIKTVGVDMESAIYQ